MTCMLPILTLSKGRLESLLHLGYCDLPHMQSPLPIREQTYFMPTMFLHEDANGDIAHSFKYEVCFERGTITGEIVDVETLASRLHLIVASKIVVNESDSVIDLIKRHKTFFKERARKYAQIRL